MKIAFKILIVFVLLGPILFITFLIWIFGGWTKGWDYMPNPMDLLLDWLEK